MADSPNPARKPKREFFPIYSSGAYGYSIVADVKDAYGETAHLFRVLFRDGTPETLEKRGRLASVYWHRDFDRARRETLAALEKKAAPLRAQLAALDAIKALWWAADASTPADGFKPKPATPPTNDAGALS